MRVPMILKQGVPLLLVAMLLGAMVGCAAPVEPPPVEETKPPIKEEKPPPPTEEEGEIQRVVEVRAEGLILHYMHQSFWGEAEFSSYLENKAQFKADFKEHFEQGLAQSDVTVSALDYSFSFDSATHSTIVRCDIDGAISKRDNSYHGTFFWLLRPLGLDFIDNHFEESERGLFWEDSVKGVPITITVELPSIDGVVYKAWAHPIGHCHAHVWWTD